MKEQNSEQVQDSRASVAMGAVTPTRFWWRLFGVGFCLCFMVFVCVLLLQRNEVGIEEDTFSDTQFTYTILTMDEMEGTVLVEAKSKSISGSVTIPESVTHGNTTYIVTVIKEDAFSNCMDLTNVVIPKSVTTIAGGAFYMCKNLTSVAIPESVASIGDWAFAYCKSLSSVKIPDNVLLIGNYTFYCCRSLSSLTIPDSVTNIGTYAFSTCTSLTSLVIPESVTSIGDFAFSDCSNLASIIIPNSVTTIGASAFYSCYSLTSVAIPEQVTTMGNWTFLGCKNLIEIKVAENNPQYCSVDGVLFNKEKTILLQYPKGKVGEYTIPQGVLSIEDRAFKNCNGLSSVLFPDSLTTIGFDSFMYCFSLTSIVIPASVTTIEGGAFFNCVALTSVYFKGNAPSLGKDVFNSTDPTIYYTEGTEGWSNPWGERPTKIWKQNKVVVYTLKNKVLRQNECVSAGAACQQRGDMVG